MTFPKLSLILAAGLVLRSVDAACVEDNCYGAIYWNPAGNEECSAHFITTVVPPPTTSEVTITSGDGDIITVPGPSLGASTIIPSDAIPTYIVRACYGDVAYRFESACSCVGSGPTTITAPQPVVTNTVIVPSLSGASIPSVSGVSIPSVSGVSISPRPLITASPGNILPEPIVVGPGAAPACLAVGLGPVIVTVQVDEFFTMSLTVVGPTFCIAQPTLPPGQSSHSTLNSSHSHHSTHSQHNTRSPVHHSSSSHSSQSHHSTHSHHNTHSPGHHSSTHTLSTAFRTTGYTNSTARFTASTSEESSSAEPTSSSPESSEFESSTSSHSFQPFETLNSSTVASSTVEPSTASTESTASAESTASEASTASTVSSSASSSPTPFAPIGPDIYIKITGGTYTDYYIETDEPEGTGALSTNLKSHVTADLEYAAVWRLDRETGILFQQIGDAWWAAYYTLGVRALFSSIMLLPAETVMGWLTVPAFQREPLRCVIDYGADFLLTCGGHGWTSVFQSDACGFTLSTPVNSMLARGCPGSQELILQAVIIYPEEEGPSK